MGLDRHHYAAHLASRFRRLSASARPGQVAASFVRRHCLWHECMDHERCPQLGRTGGKPDMARKAGLGKIDPTRTFR